MDMYVHESLEKDQKVRRSFDRGGKLG
jgi:hypothetical protein